MENLLKKIDPQKLLGRKINFSASDYFDKNCKNPQYTIVAAFFDKSDCCIEGDKGSVLKVAMVDLYDAEKDEKHHSELDEVMHQSTQKEVYVCCKYSDWLKTVWVEIGNPVMLDDSTCDTYIIGYRSTEDDFGARSCSFDDFFSPYSEWDIYDIESYFASFGNIQKQFIKMFASEEFLGREYLEQVKQKIKTHFKKIISENKREIEERQEEIEANQKAIDSTKEGIEGLEEAIKADEDIEKYLKY